MFFAGQSVSMIGDGFQQIALIFLILHMGGSGTQLALAQACLIGPRILLLLWGGVLTDRLNAKLILWTTDIIRFFTTMIIVFLLLSHTLSYSSLYSLLVLSGVAGGLFYPAFNSIVPSLVPDHDLNRANGWVESISQIAMIIGPPLAGGIIGVWGITAGFIVNACSFLVAGLTGLLIKMKEKVSVHSDTQIWHELIKGSQHVWSVKWLLGLLLVDLVASIAIIGPLTIVLPIYVQQTLHLDARLLGIVMAALGTGTAAGMLLVSRFSDHLRSINVYYLFAGIQGLFLFFVSVPMIWGILAALCIIGLFNGIGNVMMLSKIQKETPSELLGRTMSFVSLASFGAVPLSQLVCGWFMDFIDFPLIFIGASVIMIAAGGAGYLFSRRSDSVRLKRDVNHSGVDQSDP